MKKTLTTLSAGLMMAGVSHGASIAFTNFSTEIADVATNGLLADGAATDLTLSGAASGNDFLYSVSYSGASYDGDATNDTLTFDILVEAWSGGTISSTTAGANGTGNDYNDGVATIGTTDELVTLSANGFSVNGNTMGIGQSLQFTVQNLVVTTSSGSYTAALTGFTGIQLIETGNSFGHQTILGEGTGLQGVAWNAPHDHDFTSTGPGTLYVSSGSTPAGSNPQRWRMDNLDFGIDVDPIPEPSSTALLGLGGLALILRRRN